MSSLIDRVEVIPLMERASHDGGMDLFPIYFEMERDDGSILRTEGKYTSINSGQREYFSYGELASLITNAEDLDILQETIRIEVRDELSVPYVVLREWKCDECGRKVRDTEGVMEFIMKDEEHSAQQGFEVIRTYAQGFHIVHRNCRYRELALKQAHAKSVYSLDLDEVQGTKEGFFAGLNESKFIIGDNKGLTEVRKRITVPYYEVIRHTPERLHKADLLPFQVYNRRIMRNIALER